MNNNHKKTKMKLWNVDCVLTQYFTIGIDGMNVQDALDSAKLEYKNGNIDTEKENITYTTFDIKAVRPRKDE
tara:strand:- start:14 stop:229 length:216 start_codon:yes stop_codon:yes gene_type:complete